MTTAGRPVLLEVNHGDSTLGPTLLAIDQGQPSAPPTHTPIEGPSVDPDRAALDRYLTAVLDGQRQILREVRALRADLERPRARVLWEHLCRWWGAIVTRIRRFWT